ncbi:hypothetical protein LWI28_019192 [Acer negundo]|uniref:Uncharacterized protein n=1 Tax=Acer negundo TaxID=4023 RepID=A0AAD5P5I5_ACENE|nr:hypothetical protein LWI28_019192 [Acer negundo]
MKKVLTFCHNSESKISTINKQDLEIHSRTKILNMYIEAVEKKLNGIEGKARVIAEEEQDVKDRLTNLMIEGWCVVDKNGMGMVIEVSKKKEENENEKFKKEESKVEMMMMSSEEEMEVMSDLSGDDIDTNIEGLKEDMLSTLLDIKNGVIKTDHYGKNHLIDFLKAACGELDEEQVVVETIEDRDVKLGIQLSRLLVDLMIILSESVRVLEIFRTFRSSLEFHVC